MLNKDQIIALILTSFIAGIAFVLTLKITRGKF